MTPASWPESDLLNADDQYGENAGYVHRHLAIKKLEERYMLRVLQKIDLLDALDGISRKVR